MSLSALYDLPAPAKLNLFLHVTGRRADGYHLLQSLFVLIDWCDTLHLECRSDGQIHRHDLGPALPADDLCVRAARLLQQASGTLLGVDIHILKRIPSEAGMGGGSSDAATVLLGLNRLWQLNWPRQRLLELGARLGADVPFFIGGHNALVEGIGEILTPVTLPPHRFAVLKPMASAPTAKIFAHPLVKRDTPRVIVSVLLQAMRENKHSTPDTLSADSLDPESWHVMWGRNDLQSATEAICPDVEKAKKILAAQFKHARMTGSGSTVFASLKGTDRFQMATFKGFIPEQWIGQVCSSMSNHPLVDWAS